jgi:hypothetical protein
MTLLVDELANELRHYRHSQMASAALAEHILAIPRIHDALEAQRIEARSDETPSAAQPEGREPGGEAMRPKTVRKDMHGEG